MKKILLVFFLIGINLVFAESYDELYFHVIKEYGEERIQDFRNIWNYASKSGAKEVSWKVVKKLLKDGQCLMEATDESIILQEWENKI